jgi:hypothetical protein
MSYAVNTEVPFSSTIVGTCMCTQCAVQSKNQCIRGKLIAIGQVLSRSPLIQEEIPGLYRSADNATRQDLEPEQSCVCGDCNVFSQYTLAGGIPVVYFCRDGFDE